jgi:hypothetical protein
MSETGMKRTGSSGTRGLRALAVALLGVGTIVASPRDARADAYKDEKLGYSLNAPGKWKRMPLSTDEKWLVAEWQNPRDFEDADAKTNSWTRHQPKLDVIIIPNSAAEQKGAEIQKDGDKVVVKRQAPWSDLKEYMDKTTKDANIGGFFFSKEEETKVGALKVMVYEITVDKFTSTWNASPRKIYGWAFYAEDAIYGLVGDALVKFEDKVKPELDAAAKSFKIFPRTGTLPGAEITPGEDDSDVIVKGDPRKEHVTDDDLKKRRLDSFNRQVSKIKETLQSGWKVKESENFTAVTHCDDKFTKEVLDHAEALRGWLEKNLGFVGNGYAGKIILRVCADDNERSAMYKSMTWSVDRCEVVTGQDKSGWMDNKLSTLNNGIYGIWMTDKNRDLYWRLPPWISMGLSSVVGSAVSKGRTISEFKASTWDNVSIANLRRSDKLLPARQFFTMGWQAMGQDYENYRQAEYFVRYLMVGAAQRTGKYKSLLAEYLKNLAVQIDEMKDAQAAAAKDAKGGDEPKTEEEEAARQRAGQEAWKAQEAEVLKKLIEKTFAGWDDKDWNQFNASYWKELGV